MEEKALLFEKTYPNISSWVRFSGWIEIGQYDHLRSFVRALDDGGMVWEGDDEYETLDKALQALDDGIAEWADR